MSLKKIGQVKEEKYFRIWDLLVYGIIALMIAALFLTVFLTKDNTPSEGFTVRRSDKIIFTYYYASGDYEADLTDGTVEIGEEDGGKLYVTFYTPDGSGYNVILIDKVEKSVKVVDADCSSHKDCVYTPAIDDNSSIISCPPHRLLIEPLGRETDDPQEIPLG